MDARSATLEENVQQSGRGKMLFTPNETKMPFCVKDNVIKRKLNIYFKILKLRLLPVQETVLVYYNARN